MEQGYQVDAIYTDFSKAFDRVDIQLLLHKLKYYGVIGSILSWIRSYLTHRTQVVSINGHQSKVFNVTSGVSQGSHLGPVLFLLFVNDITKCFSHCK